MSWEGKTMQSETLSSKKVGGLFSPTLFWKDVTRYWPIWVGHMVVWLFILPLNIAAYAGRRGDTLSRQVSMDVANSMSAAVLVALIFGLLVGVALFSYLMNSKATGTMHALPLRREGLFLTHYAAGLAMLWAPNCAVALITLGVQAAVGSIQLGLVMAWLLLVCAVEMFFFSLTVFCAMFTGNLVAVPVFYAIVNGFAAGVSLLVEAVRSILLVGATDAGLLGSIFVTWCTPIVDLVQKTNAFLPNDYYAYHTAVPLSAFHFEELAVAVAYSLVLSIVLAVLALLVYRRRQLERAGDLVTVGWVRPVFQYGAAICCGVALGLFTLGNFFDQSDKTAFIVLTVLWSIVFCFGARMLLKKTFRVIANGWKGCAVMTLVLVVGLVGIRMDVTGYQRRVPEASQVQSISINGLSSAPYDSGNQGFVDVKDPAIIEKITEMHKTMVADLSRLESGYSGAQYDENGVMTENTTYMDLIYVMKDGSVMERKYDSVPITAEALTDPASYASQLEEILNDTTVVKHNYLYWLEGKKQVEAVGGALIQDGEDSEGRYQASQTAFAGDQAKVLWTAIQEDMDAGRIGRRYLLDDAERQKNCYVTDIQLTFLTERDKKEATVATAEADGQFTATVSNSDTRDVTFTPQITSTATLAALEELGLLDGMTPPQG